MLYSLGVFYQCLRPCFTEINFTSGHFSVYVENIQWRYNEDAFLVKQCCSTLRLWVG